MYILKYLLGKTWLDKCLKSHVSDDPYTHKEENALKYCSNLNDSPFTIFINHSEGSCIRKSLF